MPWLLSLDMEQQIFFESEFQQYGLTTSWEIILLNIPPSICPIVYGMLSGA